MTTVADHISTHMEDLFYWPKPSFHGKPADLLEVDSTIDKLEARYIKLCDCVPLPWDTLGEIEDEIKTWQKVQNRLYNEWQQSISNLRKEVLA